MTTDTTTADSDAIINDAKNQAHAQLDSVTAMIERLSHANECDGESDTCELTAEEIYEGLCLFYQDGDRATDEQIDEYHDEENAREVIQEDPLEISVRSGWHIAGGANDEDVEYNILLCTGGPAIRIIGTLDQYSQPDSAIIEYQDWGTPWTELQVPRSEELTMLAYAQQFYFGD